MTFLRPRQHHRNWRVACLLIRWGLEPDDPEAAIARRLFRNASELVSFFVLVFPAAGPVTKTSGAGQLDTGKYGVVHAPHVLKLMADLEVQREQLDSTAYFLRLEFAGRHQNGHSQLGVLYRQHIPEAQQFIRRYAGNHPDTLGFHLRNVFWMDVTSCDWTLECIIGGVPDAYVQDLVVGMRLVASSGQPFWLGKALALWEPEKVHVLHQLGVPVEYVLSLWDCPGALPMAWEKGLPSEYARALVEHD